MSRDWPLYLADIVDACDSVRAFTAGMDREAFLADVKTRDAVGFRLLTIGEAVKHLPPEVRDKAPDVEWGRIAGMRDRLAHGYFAIDAELVWFAVENRIPALRDAVARILAVEFLEGDADEPS